MSIKFEVWGDYACFSRPELKVERVSYDVITPSAARGILEAIFWKPAIKYVIDEIAVCSDIQFENIRRNEVNSKASPNVAFICSSDDRSQRAALVLRNVRYVITAHFEPTDKLGERDKSPDGSFNHGKFTDIIKRRLKTGQHFHQPYLGVREFPAYTRLIEDGDDCPAPINQSRSFGLMLYDIDFVWETQTDKKGNVTEVVNDRLPEYFFAEMNNGIIDLRNAEVLK
ncbi:MAG: type I-C CRISPR-associated protein Cas5c [Oscillospiraceae bacterium]|jgi:CRISPR-associated protein Cas5d|nr:type I-C CRISPR-associated protein Cas5c [Oscillospiraceae bacterium]